MAIHARLFLRIFASTFLGIFLAIQALLSLAGVLSLLASYPYLPIARVLAALPVVLVHVLPLSLSFAVLLAVIAYARDVDRQQGFLWIQLAGGSPRLRQWPVLAVAGALSAFLAWFGAEILPVAEYRARYGLDALADTPTSLALRLAHRPDTLRLYAAGYEEADGATMSQFSMTTRRNVPPATLVARRCESRVTEEGRSLVLDMTDGRCLQLGPGDDLRTNLQFERCSVRFDLRRLTSRPKQEIIDLRCYTNTELGRVDEQRRYLLTRGWPLKSRVTARIVDTVYALRLQAALMPLLSVLVAVGLLGAHGASRWVPSTFMLALGLAALFEESLLGLAVYKRGSSLPLALVFLPTIQACVLLGLAGILPGIRRRLRRW